MKIRYDDVWEDGLEITFRDPEINEAKVGNTSVLAVVEGPHFVPDGKSRNGRFYEKSLWDNVLGRDDVKEKINRKLVFGTIGHPKDWDAERYMREGLVSHITEAMWIDGKTGLGNARNLVLDTPAGRALNTYLRAGSRPYTSSRAYGEILNTRKVNDLPVVNPDNYEFEGFDFVLSPGFLQAQPQLKEALDSGQIILSEITERRNGGNGMEDTKALKEVIESLTKEKLALEGTISDSLDKLNAFKEIGTIDQIKEMQVTLEDVQKKLEAWSEIGEIDVVKKSLDKLKTFEEMENVDEAVEKVQAYEEMGTVEDITELLKVSEEIKTKLESYEKLGTPDQVDEALDKCLVIVKERAEERKQTAIKEIATKYSMPETVVTKLMETVQDEERVETLCKDINEGSKFKKAPKKKVDGDGKVIDEDVKADVFSRLVQR